MLHYHIIIKNITAGAISYMKTYGFFCEGISIENRDFAFIKKEGADAIIEAYTNNVEKHREVMNMQLGEEGAFEMVYIPQ